ncbi:hypothetical protein FACS1894205_7260 [Alphaproteobacteria bacterium]|nr:hypothetical protein FACS1894205_7260 [Alphaproteobacteria bacterium]
MTVAHCWSHARRLFIDVGKPSPIAEEALARIAAFYRIESEIRGKSAMDRCAGRQEKTKPLVEDFRLWLQSRLSSVSGKSEIAKALRYVLSHWEGLVRFLDDGRIEMDNNTVERCMRPIALNRKNALFAGHNEGAANWALIASLIETCKLNSVNPQTYLTDVLTKLVNNWPNSRRSDLTPWAWAEDNKKSGPTTP